MVASLSKSVEVCAAAVPRLANGLCATASVAEAKGGGELELLPQHCMKAMVVAMVFADRVLPQGVFARSSGINIRKAVQAIKRHGRDMSEAMLNHLKYTTAHYDTASGTIHKLIDGS
jgi:hypothetical protein